MEVNKMQDWFTIEQIDAATYIISEYRHWEETHCYLLEGTERALLIDTGLGICDISEIVSQITRNGKYGRMRRSYLKEHRPILYTNLLTSGTLHRHLAEIDQACNERMEIIVSAMAKQEDVTETLKASAQMEWVRHMNSIRSLAEEIVLTELVYE